MLQRKIPSTGAEIPVIGLGTWQTFDVSGRSALLPLAEVLRRFQQSGGRLIDSSPMYGNAESVVGELAQQTGLQNALFYASKVWITGARAGIREMNRSFERMRIATMDLMQVHNLVDVETHLRTLTEWKAAGRVRYIGITHYQVSAYAELERFIRRGGIDFVQFNYSVATRAAEKRLLPAAAEHQVAVLINKPFETGNLFERVRSRPLPAWAHDIECSSWSQVFLKYIIAHPAVTCVIPATSNPAHLEDYVAAGSGLLPDEALRRRMVADITEILGG